MTDELCLLYTASVVVTRSQICYMKCQVFQMITVIFKYYDLLVLHRPTHVPADDCSLQVT